MISSSELLRVCYSLGAFQGDLGVVWEPLGAHFGGLGALFGGLGVVLGRSWGLLGHFLEVLGWSLEDLGPSWGDLGGHFAARLLLLIFVDGFGGHFDSPKGTKNGPKIDPKTIKNRCRNRRRQKHLLERTWVDFGSFLAAILTSCLLMFHWFL